MVISFVGTEQGEQEVFRNALPGHDLEFVKTSGQVRSDAEILSIFIHSAIDGKFIEAHPKLRFIATRSTGYEHIDVEECARLRIPVAYVPSYGDSTVAEHTFALMLALARRLRQSSNIDPHFSYEKVRGMDLKGKVLGVIGSGRIGLHTIRIAKAFGMRVLAYDIAPQVFMAEILGFDYVPLEELLGTSHIISLHAPLVAETFHILNREALAKCRDGVLIINTARGGLIDTAALLEALDSGKVAGAGLDVLEDESVLQGEAMDIIGGQIVERLQAGRPGAELRSEDPGRIRELARLMRNSELIQRGNVVFTPHVAFNSREAVERIAQTTVENICAFIAGHPINLVPMEVPRGKK